MGRGGLDLDAPLDLLRRPTFSKFVEDLTPAKPARRFWRLCARPALHDAVTSDAGAGHDIVARMGRWIRAQGRWLLVMAGLAACAGCGGGSARPHDGGPDATTDTTPGSACAGAGPRGNGRGCPKATGGLARSDGARPRPRRGPAVRRDPGGAARAPEPGLVMERHDRHVDQPDADAAARVLATRARPATAWPGIRSPRRILLFGGSYRRQHRGLTSCGSGTAASGTWTSLTPAQRPAAWPPKRVATPAMTYDAGRGRLMVVSGFTPYVAPKAWGATYGNGTAPTAPGRTRMPDPIPAAWFEPRQYPLAAAYPSGGRPLLLGGYSGGGSLRDEMWKWDTKSATWTALTPLPRPASWPPGGPWAMVAGRALSRQARRRQLRPAAPRRARHRYPCRSGGGMAARERGPI